MTPTALVRRVGLNSGLVLGSELVRRLAAFALQLVAVRVFGDVGYGRYTFALGFVALWALGNDLGLAELTVREVARRPEEAARYLADMLGLKLVAGILVLAVLWPVAGASQPQELTLVLWAGLSVVIFAGSREGPLGVLKGRQDFRALFWLNLVGDLLTLGLGYAAVLAGYGPEGLIISTALATALSAAVSLGWCFRRFGRVRPDPRRWWPLLKAGFPFALASMFIIIYKMVDVTMLKYLLADDAVVGWYGASVRLINLALWVPMSLSAALFPALSELAHDPARLSRITVGGMRLLVALALPIGLLCLFRAEGISALLLGPGYEPAADSLRVLGLALPFVFLSYPLQVLLKAAGGEKRFALASLITGLFNLVTNFWAIPRWQHVGAAWTTLAAEVLVLIMLAAFARRTIRFTGLARPLAGTLVAAAAYGAACYLAPLWLALVLLPAYLVLLPLTGAVTREDLSRLREGFRRRGPDEHPEADPGE